MFIVLGDQLFPIKYLSNYKNKLIYMAEDEGLCRHFKYHKHKILFYLSSMRSYRDELLKNNFKLHYYEINQLKNISYQKKIEKIIKEKKVKKISTYEISDKFFKKILTNLCVNLNIELDVIPSPMFITQSSIKEQYFSKNKKPVMANFYKLQRVDLNILMNGKNPEGGQWSYDEMNRKKLPKSIEIPRLKKFSITQNTIEAKKIVENIFFDHPGTLSNFNLPTNRKDALVYFNEFLKNRLYLFGDYEDAISQKSNILFHSFLSPLLNIGLLTPDEVIKKSLSYSYENKIKINNIEGFVRQIIGWREFIKNIYDTHEIKMKKINFWNHKLRLKKSWYEGTTGIDPLDYYIKEINKDGYAHHIVRLMLISNIMNLCGVHPDEIYKWFMEMFVDSTDWVMVPNVYGMGTFSDGGLFATKPYICGSNYLIKMSDFKKGDWCEIVDGLYWKFIKKNKTYIKSNHRLSMMAYSLDKIDIKRTKKIFSLADKFIEKNTY